jgi:8-oxo-dGTP diphosphatase
MNSHGDGTLALPGGHLEMYESWETCAMREAMEETGLALRNVTFGHVTNDIMMEEGRHYVTIIMMAECADGDAVPRNLEPRKCGGWHSYSWEELRERAGAGRRRGGGPGGGPEDDDDDDDDDDDESGGGGGRGPALFGPLSKLVEDAPRNVLDFINKSS